LNLFKAISFTHKSIGLQKVAQYNIASDDISATLQRTKKELALDELLILSTCNRVELYFVTDATINDSFLCKLYASIYPYWSAEEIEDALRITKIEDGLDAVRHVFHVVSSLDSLVVGEREILTQFKGAYKTANEAGTTGDYIRLLERAAIETAKRVFTETEIANRQVSVVNLAVKSLVGYNIAKDAKVLVIGAGVTNTAAVKRLHKLGFSNFTVANRTYSKAQDLANLVNGEAISLKELPNYKGGFDVLLSCTGANETVVTKELYAQLVNGASRTKICH